MHQRRMSRSCIIVLLQLFYCIEDTFVAADSENVMEKTVYTQALLSIKYDSSTGKSESVSINGKYGEGGPIQNSKGYLFYSPAFGDWCKDHGRPNIKFPWIAVIPRSSNCTDQDKMLVAKKNNASAVIIYNNERTGVTPKMPHALKNIVSVIVSGNTGADIIKIIQAAGHRDAFCEIIVGTHFIDRKEWKVSRTSVLFVLVSFILLMCISLAWLVFYYVQRFRHIYRNDRKEKQLLSAAKKAISKLKTVSFPNSNAEEDDSCAVCLESYKDGESLRILPCKHEFHKSCIDPWLLTHRTCPMCKSNILKALGVDLPFDVSVSQTDQNDVEAFRSTTGADTDNLPMREGGAENNEAETTSSVATNTEPTFGVCTSHAWQDQSASSYSSGSSTSSEDNDSDRSTVALVTSAQRV